MMRVILCVDSLKPQLSGIGRYTWELCQGLPKLPEITELRFWAWQSEVKDPTRLLREWRPKWHRRQLSLLRRVSAARFLRRGLVHGPNYFLPRKAEKGIITIHDLSVFHYPESHPPERVAAFERLFASSLDRAVHVITDTQAVRREVLEGFSIAPARVTSVPLGVDATFRPMKPCQTTATLAQWNLRPNEYGLSVAAFEPRKKIIELISAWRRLPLCLRNNFPLVLAGAAGWRNEALHEAILDAESEGWLKYLGYVEESLLPYLYAGARLFVYPSAYEGFGLPPIEAMASGTPVIVSNRSCLPEVCDAAARLIDPDDPDGFTSAIEECLVDEPWRSTMIACGLERARLYSWERCVKNTVAVYRKASS